MKIVITGAGGLIGGALDEHFRGSLDVVALRHRDLDIADRAAVVESLGHAKPDLVINCAVLQVDPCEMFPEKARAINVVGPRNLAEVTEELGAEVLHFSTNYVFDGRTTGRKPYSYEDETLPINVYGQTKLEGEWAVRESSPQSYIVRTAWVYGLGKASFLADAPRRLRRGEPIQAITDAFSTTTYVRDLVKRVGEIIACRRYGIYHVVNEGTCSYYEFAVECARLVGLDEARAAELIIKVRDQDLQRAAPRPHWTPLECRLSREIGLAPLRNWRDALAAYIAHDLRNE